MYKIPNSYEDSLDRFKTYLTQICQKWPSASLNSQELPWQKDVTIDWIIANALDRQEKLFVISIGEHGIEGYVGSAILHYFINEFLPKLNQQNTGVLLIHAINPWGMKNWRRCNPANVDLNRNFITGDFSKMVGTNPDYRKLSSFLSPQISLRSVKAEKWHFLTRLVKTMVQYGSQRIREAALSGQYYQPTGIYFGGEELQPETKQMMEVYEKNFSGYSKIVHLDIHTGYGPRNQMTLVNSPLEPMSAAETAQKYQIPLVAAANPDEFYTMQGDMIDWEYAHVKQHSPSTLFFGATCEFGTFGDSILAGARSLQITIMKNQLNLFGATDATKLWVDHEYKELYCPVESAWHAKVTRDAHQTFENILKTEGYI